jgi:rubrerythrin
MWKKTALEEENHQQQFELAHRIRNDVGYELNVDVDRACRVYQKLNVLLEHVRKNPPEVTTALTKALEMEETLADLHLDCSVHFQDESITQMFLAMRAFDQDHVAAMRRCLTITTLSKSEMAG